DLEIFRREVRSILAGPFQVGVGITPLEHHGCKVGVPLTGCYLGSFDVLRRVDYRHSDEHVFGKTYLGFRVAAGTNRLYCETVAHHRIVADLVQLAIRKPQPWGTPQVHGLFATNLYIKAFVAAFHE